MLQSQATPLATQEKRGSGKLCFQLHHLHYDAA